MRRNAQQVNMTDSNNTPAPDDLKSWGLTRSTKVVLVVDLVESVRLMENDEALTIRRWQSFLRRVTDDVLPQTRGRLVKSMGDGLMAEFTDARRAVVAALALHDAADAVQREVLPVRSVNAPFLLRAGAHSAEVFADAHDIYGAGVNLAARLTAIAQPGGTVATSNVRDELDEGLDVDWVDLGPCFLKHVAQPVRVWRLQKPNGALAARMRPEPPPSPADAPVRRIAVAPFQAKGGTAPSDALDACIGLLIAERLRAFLGQMPFVQVTDGASLMPFANREQSVVQIAQLTGAQVVVQGSFAREGERLTVDVSVWNGADENQIWQAEHSGQVAELTRGDGAVVHELASGVWSALSEDSSSLSPDAPLPQLSSFALMHAGMRATHLSLQQSFLLGERMLGEVVHRHPSHAAPKAWLAKWHAIRFNRGLAREPDAERLRVVQLAREAHETNTDDAFAATVHGLALGFFKQDFGGAREQFTRALRKEPSQSMAWLFLGTLNSWTGRGQEAQVAATQALALNPIGPLRYYYFGHAASAALANGDHATALQWADISLRSNALHASSYRVKAIALVHLSRAEEARAVVRQLLIQEPSLTGKRFLERYPGRNDAHAQNYVRALKEAGLP